MNGVAFDPEGLLRTLNEHGVDYVVIGGVAVIAHGYVRSTADVDIVPAPGRANMERLAGALEALDALISGVDADLLGIELNAASLAEGANFTLDTRLGPLDVMQDVPGAPPYAELAARAPRTRLEGVEVKVCGLGDLKAMKEASGREEDRADLARLGEIEGLRGQP